jgi:hypothetical protein
MGELHMEYVKEGCNTPVKKACKSTNIYALTSEIFILFLPNFP